jgi:malonyl-CoA O-methyltransferase
LQELRLAWAAVDSYAHVNRFYSQSEIISFLQTAGFEVLVASVALHAVAYESVMALMQALKAIGAHNVNQQRKRTPTTRQQLLQMQRHYPQTADGIIASYEVLFFQARRRV